MGWTMTCSRWVWTARPRAQSSPGLPCSLTNRTDRICCAGSAPGQAGPRQRQPGRTLAASTGAGHDGDLHASHAAPSPRSTLWPRRETTSRSVMEKAGENARRAADLALCRAARSAAAARAYLGHLYP